MPKVKDWLSAARLRTLPLAFSSIITGAAIAASRAEFNLQVFLLALLTTLGLQVLSNYANDYGDFNAGTDNDTRVGPERALQSGKISKKQMKTAILWMAIFSLLSGLGLLYLSGILFNEIGLVFLVAGLIAIAAAIKYTAGKNPYGYIGLGDISVFVFFGMLGVFGSCFLHDLSIPYTMDVFPAATIGFLSTSVLNLNNMRDAIPDEAAGKITMAVRLGPRTSKIYHAILISLALICMLYYLLNNFNSPRSFLALIVFPLLIAHLIKVFRTTINKDLDPELKKVALSTFILSILFFISSYSS